MNRREQYRTVYLQSDHWQKTRVAALERAEYRCQLCNSDKALDVHHRTYERVGEERPADLTVLCRKCHTIFHGSGRQPQKAKKAKASRRRASKSQRQAATKASQLGAANERLHRIQAENRVKQQAVREARRERVRVEACSMHGVWACAQCEEVGISGKS